MGVDRCCLIFGPAYLDVVVETAHPLLPNAPTLLLDQSLTATACTAREDGVLVVSGPTGDLLRFPLPPAANAAAATWQLAEPVLARLQGDTASPLVGEFPVACVRTQLGGMGAGFAKAFDGLLRAPFGTEADGPDVTARQVLAWLAQQQIRVTPAYLPGCASDSSLVLLSARGDKLAIGVRKAMVRWQASTADHTLLTAADALVFCGAPNSLMAEVLSGRPSLPVMCAPSLRNTRDRTTPLAFLATHIHYLSMNALEWAQLAEREQLRANVPVITITDGPHGSRVFLRAKELHIPAQPYQGPANTNRAGETYASTFFKVLLAQQPDFYLSGAVPDAVARHAGQCATTQATKQLGITGFAFPEEELRNLGI